MTIRPRHLLSVAALALAVQAPLPALAAELNFTSWGGSWQEAQESTALRPFGAKFKVRVRSDTYNGGIAQLRAQVQTGNVSWDVIDMQLSDAVRACEEGLLEKINPATDLAPAPGGQPAAQDYLPRGLTDCLAGNIIWSSLLAYNKTKVGARPPSRVADFFDLKAFPGKRGLRKSPEGALEWALMADGVAAAEVYQVLATPAGVARAFRKLDTIKSAIIWWEAGAQPPQLLADGEVVMTSAYIARIFSAIRVDRKPFEILWDGQLQNHEGYVIAKGAKNLKEARAFIRYATEPAQLAALAPLTAHGPLRHSANAMVDPKVLPYLPTTPRNARTAVQADADFWADHGDDLNQRFAAWLNRP